MTDVNVNPHLCAVSDDVTVQCLHKAMQTVEILALSYVFVAVFLGCTSTGRVGLCCLWFYVQELPKAQSAVVLVLKRLRRRGNGLKSHPTDWEKPGIEPATPGLQDLSDCHTLPDSTNGCVTESKIICPFVSVCMRFLSVPHAVNALCVK